MENRLETHRAQNLWNSEEFFNCCDTETQLIDRLSMYIIKETIAEDK